MKQNLLLLCIALGFIVPVNVFAENNLLKNSNMEEQGAWLVSYLNSEETDRPTAEWGYTQSIPATASGGVLHISKSAAAATSQYCIYQQVSLSADSIYEIDAAFKVAAGWENTWFEGFVSQTAPVDGEDFGSEATQIVSFSVWANPQSMDGTLQTAANGDKKFQPSTSGDYYLVIKTGCLGGGNFDIMLDNVSFKAQRTPTADFTADARSGFAPFAVNFTSSSLMADTYEWTFGDGSTSSDENPAHTYQSVGNYTVTLKVTNQYGDDTETKTNYIEVRELQQITGGGILQGGNMESADNWEVVTLNSPADQKPTATWNYTGTQMPSAGQSGALRIQGNALNAVSQYCIYQRVTLSLDKVYRFNAAFRDISPSLMNFFTEVFIGQEIEPDNVSDFGSADGVQLAGMGCWDSNSSLIKLDGTFQIHSTVADFIPETSGEYIFVFKVGVNSWGDEARAFDIIVDELLLEELSTKPYTNFTAENSRGFAPLQVQFTNTTLFGASYLWDFGDGSTSTEQNPTHTYNSVGKYTVSLKATNAQGDSTIVKTDFIAVNERPELPEGEKLYGGSMDESGYWYTARIGAAVNVNLTWNYTDDIPTGGEGGALRLQADLVGGQGSNIALYQPIDVKKGYEYTFDGLFKAIGNTNNLWVQAFMITEEPNDDGEGDALTENNCWGQLNTWIDGSITSYDGVISEKAVIGSAHAANGGKLLAYHHTGDDAKLYFVLKIGTWEHAMDITLDNLTLTEAVYVPQPVADFSADVTSGDAPLTVQFFNQSSNASIFSWNFGDGNTSTEEEPEHTYATAGTYTVSLTVTNGTLNDTKTIENMITVGGSGLAETLFEKYAVSIENNRITVKSTAALNVNIYSIDGGLLESKNTAGSEFISKDLVKGVYILQLNSDACKVVLK